ncbi:SDR family NAD(P)-dependent oxidoreductase [Pedobacter cryoconitis]|uniref:SDR family NAD(P)-dependent oxidoreductase n=1 Tax=Pedobacter cryoconitis TaxID=188932 RepID=UPI00161B9A4E|nr:SDR family NAD(P)-dependent oxidoreductase [Pedobacter cryoconitis]MBB5646100.1 NAD(P)-dependent dehydrogenase (short-subunit alcohol dehydrogenase family) [Pedobacter cryoconitis]
MVKIIMITGASRGFGRIWTEAFLKRGDQVIATARSIDSLNDLADVYKDAILPLKLDVNNREDCLRAVEIAKAHFGRIDVLINNAGYGLFGAIEETSELEARSQFETNVFGLLWMTQAVLPVMRAQNNGHIVQLSSLLGVVSSPVVGLYTASKWAVEGLSESLAAEVSQFGIKVTILEPNGFNTDWSGLSSLHASPLTEYDIIKTETYQQFTPSNFGDPKATVPTILKLIDESDPPLRLFLGRVAFAITREVYAQRIETWLTWEKAAIDAHGK